MQERPWQRRQSLAPGRMSQKPLLPQERPRRVLTKANRRKRAQRKLLKTGGRRKPQRLWKRAQRKLLKTGSRRKPQRLRKRAKGKLPPCQPVMSEAYSGRKYRCIVTAGTQSVTSRAALLTFAEPEIVIEGVVYELIDDVMTVTGYRGTADDVVVQETVEGHTVTVIGEGAFENKTSISQIDLPDTIVLIRKRAFAGCSNLSNMN